MTVVAAFNPDYRHGDRHGKPLRRRGERAGGTIVGSHRFRD